MSVRHALLRDIPTICEIAQTSFKHTFDPITPPDDMALYLRTAFSPATLTEEYEQTANTFFVSSHGTELAGMGKLARSDTLELQRLYVRPSHFRRGHGRALMTAMLTTARDEGWPSIWLGVWEHNTRALALYQALGFEITGAKSFVVGTDVQSDLVLSLRVC